MKFVASSLLISGLETVKERKMSPSQQTQTAQKINRLMRRLQAKHFVQCSSSTWSLTPKGRSRGSTIQRNHRLWTQYLISHADIAANHVDWSVDQVEHVLSDDLVAQLEDQLRHGAEP